MRIQHRYLTFDSHVKTIKPVKSILDRYAIAYKYKEDIDSVIPSFRYLLEFYLYEDTPDFSELKRILDKFDIDPQTGTEYEKADFEKADWFIVSTGEYQYPQPDGDFGYLKATFNLDNHCPICGIGKVQNAPYQLRTEPKQQNSQFWGLHWEFEAIFAREAAKNILEKENIKGISFSRPILHKNNAEITSIYQLHIDTVLNKGLDSYNTKQITCRINNEENLNTDPALKCCGRVKFHHPMIGGYLFTKDIFNPAFDIVQSHEYFGSGGSANRLRIVSRRIKQLVEKNKLKGLSFIPIVHDRFKRQL